MKNNTFLNIIDFLSPFFKEESSKNVIDLSTKEGLDKFNSYLDALKNNDFGKTLLESFTGENIDSLKNLAKTYYNACNKDDGAKIDESLKEVKDNKKDVEDEVEFERPSKNIDVNIGLQIHKIVQEYIDTMVKPYVKGRMSEESINDAYVGLYEFACWVYNKPPKK